MDSIFLLIEEWLLVSKFKTKILRILNQMGNSLYEDIHVFLCDECYILNSRNNPCL